MLNNTIKILVPKLRVLSLNYSSTMSPRIISTALIQMNVGKNKEENLKHASELIDKAKSQDVDLICLPECFNSPYSTNLFRENSESVPNGISTEMLSKAAKKHGVFLVGGTIPEIKDDKIYNTCTVWNPCGEMIAKFRKMHLFDMDIPGGITFKESDSLSSGNNLVTFDLKGVKIGLGICYDLRFEEMAKLYRKRGCELLIYPGAFNMTTGPMHWELLQRSRALDNQVYVCAISPARGTQGYIAWGHSQVTDPWGKVVANAGHEEQILYCDLKFEECDKIRSQIPIFKHRRTELYDTIEKM